MQDNAQLMARLASQLCEGDEACVDELRDALLDRLLPMLANPAVGPGATLEEAFRRVAAGHTGLVCFPSDAPRVAWTLEENGIPVEVCVLLGAPYGRVLGDPLCFECAMLANACVREVCLVANTAAICEGEFDEVMDPVMSVLRTARPDEDDGDDEACGCGDGEDACECDGDACECGHPHGDACECDCEHGGGCECDGDACACGYDHEHGDGCDCDECVGEDDEPELAVSVALECCDLTSEQLCQACDAISSAMPDCIVVSTGLGARCATAAEVRLVAATVEPGVAVRATTDARTLEEALDLFEAGATELACLNPADIVADFDRVAAALMQ
jgi:deoxyribose-phosphate aldolase